MTAITTPVDGFTGAIAGVHFIDGRGETDDPTALAYFKRHGYGIKEPKAPAKAPAKKAASKPSEK